MYCIDRGPQLTGGSTTWPTFTVFEEVCCWKKERNKQNESRRVCVCVAIEMTPTPVILSLLILQSVCLRSTGT